MTSADLYIASATADGTWSIVHGETTAYVAPSKPHPAAILASLTDSIADLGPSDDFTILSDMSTPTQVVFTRSATVLDRTIAQAAGQAVIFARSSTAPSDGDAVLAYHDLAYVCTFSVFL